MGGYKQNDNEPFNENMLYDFNRVSNSPWPLPREASCDRRYEQEDRDSSHEVPFHHLSHVSSWHQRMFSPLYADCCNALPVQTHACSTRAISSCLQHRLQAQSSPPFRNLAVH
jgi:hypothetical protein